MTYREFTPSPPLRATVACYWSAVSEAGSLTRVLPDGCIDFVFELGTGGASPSLVGVMTTALVVPHAARCDRFGVRFRPGGAAAFVDVFARETCDSSLSLATLWGGDAGWFGERLAAAGDASERALVADAVLRSRLDPRRAEGRGGGLLARAAVALIDDVAGACRIGELCDHLVVGERALERAFSRYVGLGPKLYARVARLRALDARLARAAPDWARLARAAPDWARLAAEHGYYDQAHLAGEVRRLTGLTPRAFAAERRGVGFLQDGLGASP